MKSKFGVVTFKRRFFSSVGKEFLITESLVENMEELNLFLLNPGRFDLCILAQVRFKIIHHKNDVSAHTR